jgi:hypothetical protein
MAETGSEEMGTYNPARSYGLVIYTDDFKGEAHRFFVYNFKGWRVPASTAHYIESKTQSPHIHSRLARELMERSGVLGAQNVELLTNQLSRNSAKMVTFGTLVEALRVGFPDLVEDSYAEVCDFLIDFLGELGRARPAEIALLSVAQRQRVRERSMADQTVMWHGYFRFASWLREHNPGKWRDQVEALGRKNFAYEKNGKRFVGDLFDRENHLWVDNGLLALSKKGALRVINSRETRTASFEILKEITERGSLVGIEN